jgi:hypothetical protein
VQLIEIRRHACLAGTVGGRIHETSKPFAISVCCMCNACSLDPMTMDLMGVRSCDANGMFLANDSFTNNSQSDFNFNLRHDSVCMTVSAANVASQTAGGKAVQ